MDSLATLHHDGTTCVPLELEPRLKQNLQDLLVNNEAPAEETLQCFLRDARLVFQAVMVSQTQHKTVSISSQWTTANILELHYQLEELEIETENILIQLSNDLSTLTLQTTDDQKRHHVMRMTLSNFPAQISVEQWDVPQQEAIIQQDTHKRQRTEPPTILDMYLKFVQIVKEHQELWNQLDDIDANTWVLEPSTNRSSRQRSIYLSEGAKLILILDALALPTIQFLGSQSRHYKDMYQSFKWNKERSVRNNLEACFQKSLAKPNEDAEENSTPSASTTDCGICFGATTSTEKCSCENPKCARPFHSSCLEKWLSSLTTSRTSFDTIIGSCPYCKDPIAVQIVS